MAFEAHCTQGGSLTVRCVQEGGSSKRTTLRVHVSLTRESTLIVESSHRRKFRTPSPPRYSSRLVWEHGRWAIQTFIGEEYTHAMNVALLASTVYLVARSTHDLFGLENDPGSGDKRLTVSALGGSLIGALRMPLYDMAAAFPECELNPLYGIFQEVTRQRMNELAILVECDSLTGYAGPDAALIYEQLDWIVKGLRRSWDVGEIARALEPVRRRVDLQWSETEVAVTDAFAGCARVLAVHLDLHFLQRSPSNHLSAPDALSCMRKFQRYLNRSFPLVRFFRCIEYGRESGFRFRFIVLLNAYLVADAAAQGIEMGEHWNAVITAGAGAYCCFNVPSRSGLGMIAFTEKDRIEALLEQEIALVVKSNFWIHYVGQRKSVQISLKERRPVSTPRSAVTNAVSRSSAGLPAVPCRSLCTREAKGDGPPAFVSKVAAFSTSAGHRLKHGL